MMKSNEQDRVAVARYADGEMAAGERAAFETRLHAEPALAEVLSETRALRGVFGVARQEVAPPLRAGFSDRVLQRLQHGAGGESGTGVERRVLRLARACVVAAAIVFAVAMLFATGLLQLPDSGQLQANDSAELIRALDAKIKAAEALQRATGR